MRSVLAALLLAASVSPLPAADLVIPTRNQTETAPGTGRYHVLPGELRWNPAKTAVVVCDMWDKHWSPTATERTGEMAPSVDRLLKHLRKQGVFVIHCPSDCMAFYTDTPQRKLAQAAPKVDPPATPAKAEPKLPIDDSDGGCDAQPPGKTHIAWKRQIATIAVEEGDAVAEKMEPYYLLQQRGIENVFVLGVHTNMCILNRPFAIRALTRYGKNVVLVRDLTDTMYNPRKAPFVSHFTGTDYVIDHIERHLCPTTTSAALLGTGKPFRFKEDTRPHLAVVTAEDEYKTEETLPEFARMHLGQSFRVTMVYGSEKDRTSIPGIEVLQEADAALFSIRRRPLRKEQLEVVREFVKAGKPLVAIRTTSHAFAPKKGQPVPEGAAEWADFDREVLGCHYDGHYPEKEQTFVRVPAASEGKPHPVLARVPAGEELKVASSLYRSSPLVDGAELLLVGRAGDAKPEPVAWVRKRADGGRLFYTSLGHAGDFKLDWFNRLLANGTCWAAGVKASEAVGKAE